MDLRVLAQEIKDGEWEDLLPAAAASEVVKLSVAELHARLLEACGTRGGPILPNYWFDIWWTASWVNALLAAGIAPSSTVLEVGPGISSNFVRASSALLGSRGRYIGININQSLAESFQRRNRLLPIRMRFLHGDALHVDTHLAEGSCAFVAFNHQIDDCLQALALAAAGRTTGDGDWLTLLPDMVRLTLAAHASGSLERTLRPQFLAIIRACVRVLRPGGVLGFSNAIVSLLLKLGYSEELLGDYIPLARRWFSEDLPDLREERYAGFDPKWWLFFRKG